MPSVEERRNSRGEITSYRITVSVGYDKDGKQIKRRKLWTPAQRGLTEAEMKREAVAEAYRFEDKLKQGYVLDDRQTFAEYALYVLDLKERTGVKPRTIDRYLELLPRINAEIGFLKIIAIRPQHLNDLYQHLMENARREDCVRAAAKRSLMKRFREWGQSRQKLAKAAGICPATVTVALNGDPVRVQTAEAIAAVLNYPVGELFTIRNNDTPLSNKTVLEHHRLISTVLAQAEKEMLIPYNPASKATPPKVRRTTPDYFQPEEMDAILAALDEAPLKWRAITYLLIDTGCRRGEIMGLKWSNVNFATGVITIDCALLHTKSKGIYEGETKTGGIRAVRIAPQTLALLEAWQGEYRRLKELNGDRWRDTPYVFVRDDGRAMYPDSITAWLGEFSRKHGLPHIHPHAFRHTAASTMIANGVDLVTTAAELGHANANTTAMIYAHQIAVARATASKIRGGVFDRRK